MQIAEIWSYPHKSFQKHWSILFCVKKGITMDSFLNLLNQQTQGLPPNNPQASNQELLEVTDGDTDSPISAHVTAM